MIELRLLDVPGDVLGAALAEVESHCAESGEKASEVFGDPVAYARSLDLPVQPAGRWDVVTVLGPVGSQVLGMLVLGWGGGAAVNAWRTGEADATVGLTVGMLLMVVVLGVALLLLARHSSTVLRRVLDRPVVSWLVLTLLTGSLGVGAVLLDSEVLVLRRCRSRSWGAGPRHGHGLERRPGPPGHARGPRRLAAAGRGRGGGRRAGRGARVLSSLITWVVPSVHSPLSVLPGSSRDPRRPVRAGRPACLLVSRPRAALVPPGRTRPARPHSARPAALGPPGRTRPAAPRRWPRAIIESL
ncbi:hypothetical protein NKG05_23990 [Oerskovia sp. M15]